MVLRETDSRNIPLKLLLWARAAQGGRGCSQEHGLAPRKYCLKPGNSEREGPGLSLRNNSNSIT